MFDKSPCIHIWWLYNIIFYHCVNLYHKEHLESHKKNLPRYIDGTRWIFVNIVCILDEKLTKFCVYCAEVKSGNAGRSHTHIILLYMTYNTYIGYPYPAGIQMYYGMMPCVYVAVICPAHVCVLVKFAMFQTINDAIYDGRKYDCCFILLLLHVLAD